MAALLCRELGEAVGQYDPVDVADSAHPSSCRRPAEPHCNRKSCYQASDHEVYVETCTTRERKLSKCGILPVRTPSLRRRRRLSWPLREHRQQSRRPPRRGYATVPHRILHFRPLNTFPCCRVLGPSQKEPYNHFETVVQVLPIPSASVANSCAP